MKALSLLIISLCLLAVLGCASSVDVHEPDRNIWRSATSGNFNGTMRSARPAGY